MAPSLLAFVVPFFLTGPATPLPGGQSVVFLDDREAQEAITEDRHDPFFRTLSQLDTELRLAESLGEATTEQRIALLKKQYRDAVQPWKPEEADAVAGACRSIALRAATLHAEFAPKLWRFVKTDGSEEAGAAYTRHDTVILPAGRLNLTGPSAEQRLLRLVAHETAHVFSRLNPRVRDRLYGRLGFRKVGPIRLGEFLERRRITNPDGPVYEHALRAKSPDGSEFDGAIMIYSKADRYAPEHGRRLFDYLRFQFFRLEQVNGEWRVAYDPMNRPIGFEVNQITGFFEQTSRNTQYIIHPDEILAENLSLLFSLPSLEGPGAANIDTKLLSDLAAILAAP